MIEAERLNTQYGRVFAFMSDGQWYTLRTIAAATKPASEAAVSARLRDMRKKEFGSHTVERRRVEGVSGLWQYRLVIS